MRRIAVLCALLMLMACAAPNRFGAEDVMLEEAPSLAADADTKCQPGEGDGIGGTGCAID